MFTFNKFVAVAIASLLFQSVIIVSAICIGAAFVVADIGTPLALLVAGTVIVAVIVEVITITLFGKIMVKAIWNYDNVITEIYVVEATVRFPSSLE